MSATPDIELVIPNAPVLSAPQPGQSDLDAETLFQWTGDARVYRLEGRADAGCDRLFVLTKDTEVALPVAPRSDYELPRAAKLSWHVTTRGFGSVDEALDMSGYDSPLLYGLRYGSERVAGTLAISAERAFRTAP